MKVYMCKPKRASWCDNDACVVIANNEQEVKEMLKKNNTFDEEQGQVNIKEIELCKSQILLISNVGA
ncbi:MAG: hypothetical protein WC343_02820 [Bacilli bacterium]|jgi:hypothetical protein